MLQIWAVNNFYLNLAKVWDIWSILIASWRAVAVLLCVSVLRYTAPWLIFHKWSWRNLWKMGVAKVTQWIQVIEELWFRSSLILNQEFLRQENLNCVCIIKTNKPKIKPPKTKLNTKIGGKLWVKVHFKLINPHLIFLILIFMLLFLSNIERVIFSDRQDPGCWGFFSYKYP